MSTANRKFRDRQLGKIRLIVGSHSGPVTDEFIEQTCRANGIAPASHVTESLRPAPTPKPKRRRKPRAKAPAQTEVVN